MESPLWTDEFAPEISDLPQPDARDYFETAVDEPLNLVVHGPPGVGKTAAVRALAAAAHEDPDNDLVELNVADFFDRTKKEIKNDERFASFLRGNSRMSKRDMINHVLKESASYQPVSGRYKTVLLDNAEAIREDFQQALRRVMERYAENTQFVIATRQPSKLIPRFARGVSPCRCARPATTRWSRPSSGSSPSPAWSTTTTAWSIWPATATATSGRPCSGHRRPPKPKAR